MSNNDNSSSMSNDDSLSPQVGDASEDALDKLFNTLKRSSFETVRKALNDLGETAMIQGRLHAFDDLCDELLAKHGWTRTEMWAALNSLGMHSDVHIEHLGAH